MAGDTAALEKAARTLSRFLALRFPAALTNYPVEGYIDAWGELKLGSVPPRAEPRHVFGRYQVDCARNVVFRNSVPVIEDPLAAYGFASDLRQGLFDLFLLFLRERVSDLQRQIEAAERDLES